MRAAAALLATLATLAGCTLAPPGGDDGLRRISDGTEALQFAPPVQALPFCAIGLGSANPCFEPSVVVDGASRLVASNGYGRDVARSGDEGTTWVPGLVTSPLGQPLAAGGDALVQRAPDGSVWRSALLQTRVTAQRSTDGGLTWSTDGIADFGVPVDRNWMGFAGGTAFLHIQGDAGVHVVMSRDDGASWGDPVQLLPRGLHGPGATIGERFVLPLFDYEEGELAAYATSDGGATWERSRISHVTGDFFPMLAADGDNLHAVWRVWGDLAMAKSVDGGRTWTAPTAINLAPELVQGSPWVMANGGVVTVLYFVADDPAAPATLRAVRINGDEVERGTLVSDVRSNGVKAERAGNTDHAHGDLLPDGRLVAAFAAGTGALMVVRQSA